MQFIRMDETRMWSVETQHPVAFWTSPSGTAMFLGRVLSMRCQ